MNTGGHQLLAAVAAARSAVSELLRAPTGSLSDGELCQLMDGVQALSAQAEAVRLARVRCVDARPEVVPGATAARAASAFLVSRRVSPRQARFDVAVAQCLDPDSGPLRELGAAFAAGLVWREHVDVAVRALQRIPRRKLAEVHADGRSGAEHVDAYLAEQSSSFAPSNVEALARHLLAVLDPEGTDRQDAEAFMRRRCHAAFDSTGMLIGSFQLDPEAGAVFSAALAVFSAPRPAALSVTPDGEMVEERDVRDKGQRQADALATICGIALGQAQPGRIPDDIAGPGAEPPDPVPPGTAELSSVRQEGARQGSAPQGSAPQGSAPQGSAPSAAGQPGRGRVGRVPAHILVIADIDQLAGNPGAGLATTNLNAPISPGTLRRLACDAVLQRVLRAPSGAVLDLGRSVRLVTPAQRRAITVRDSGCLIPGCGVPVATCDIHHVRSWADGGPTDLPNLAPLCSRHHTAVHAGEWALVVHDGLPWVIPPPWADPLRRPVRNPLAGAVQAALRLGQVMNGASEEPAQMPNREQRDQAAVIAAGDTVGAAEHDAGNAAVDRPSQAASPGQARDGGSVRRAA